QGEPGGCRAVQCCCFVSLQWVWGPYMCRSNPLGYCGAWVWLLENSRPNRDFGRTETTFLPPAVVSSRFVKGGTRPCPDAHFPSIYLDDAFETKKKDFHYSSLCIYIYKYTLTSKTGVTRKVDEI
ncbi:hypothetical protein TcCL_ESM02370, partial [Trypanosoma cruzi]